MKLGSKFLNGEMVSTLVATAICGGVIYALTDFGFWACAFFGYVTTEAVSSANRVTAVETDLAIANRKLSEAQQQVEDLGRRLWLMQERHESESRPTYR